MTTRRAAALAVPLLILLALRRGDVVVADAPVTVPEPAEALCTPAPGAATPAPAPFVDDADDTGGPLVTLDVRGTLRIDAVRDDGTPEPDAVLELINCPPARQRERGAVSLWRMDPGPCTVVAWRPDGILRTPYQMTRIRIAAGEETRLAFTFPAEVTAGVGISYHASDVGLEVDAIVPGSPAEAAGLVAGDLVLAIDGEDVEDLTDEELADLLTGSEGTPVSLTLAFEGETGLLEEEIGITRAFLPAD